MPAETSSPELSPLACHVLRQRILEACDRASDLDRSKSFYELMPIQCGNLLFEGCSLLLGLARDPSPDRVKRAEDWLQVMLPGV